MEKHIGQIVAVEFVDHVHANHGGESLMECIVYGQLTRVEDDCIEVMGWHSRDDTATRGNDEVYLIARGTISKIVLLRKDDTI